MFNRYRIGTITLAITFVGVGVAVLWANLTAEPVWDQLLKWWPAVLILLGVEVILRHTLAREGEHAPRWDPASIIILVFAVGAMALGTLVVSVLGSVVTSTPEIPRLLADIVGTQVKATDERHTQLSLEPLDTLRIDNPMGSVRVVPASGDSYGAEARVTVFDINNRSATALLDTVELSFTGGKTPHLAVKLPPREPRQSVTADLVVTVPTEIDLEVNNAFGEVNIRDISGGLFLENRHGDVHLESLVGDIKVYNEFGNLEGLNLHGDVRVDGEHAGVNLTTVTGSVQVDTGFAEVRLSDIDGDVRVQTQHAPASFTGITGSLSVLAEFSRIDADQVDGAVDLETSHDAIQFVADEVRTNVDITNEYGDIELNLPTAGYRLNLESAHGNIRGVAEGAVLEQEPDRQTLTWEGGPDGSADDPLVRAYTSRGDIDLTVR